MEWQIQQDAWGSAHIVRVSHHAFMRTVRKWLKMKNCHLVTLQIWMPWRYHVWEAMHEAILKPSSKAQNSFW